MHIGKVGRNLSKKSYMTEKKKNLLKNPENHVEAKGGYWGGANSDIKNFDEKIKKNSRIEFDKNLIIFKFEHALGPPKF